MLGDCMSDEFALHEKRCNHFFAWVKNHSKALVNTKIAGKWMFIPQYILVGGLGHFLFFPYYWECHHPN
jgi:hypothetical protein